MEKLSSEEARVLGSLLEKEMTTPEYYPLSVNALMNACNQKSSRDPVVSYDEAAVQRALDSLMAKGMARLATGADSRVRKYRHNITDKLMLREQDRAVLCVLLLRGPQTLGELRTRTERMHPFKELGEVEATLNELAASEMMAMVVKLPRQAGSKEGRYAQLFTEVPVQLETSEPQPPLSVSPAERIHQLEEEIQGLKDEFAQLRQQFMDFRKLFE
jgi:uncharacterized protein YceH (UPF0502 family)